jgi:hypothetical protein
MITKQLAGTMDKAPGFKMWQRQRFDLFLSTQKYMYNLGSPGGDNAAAAVTGLAFPATFNQTTLTAQAAAGATVLNVVGLNGAVNIGDFIGILVGSDYFWTTVSAFNAGAKSITIPAPGLSGIAAKGNQVVNYTTKAQCPLKILTAVLRDSSATDTDLREMTLETYEGLPTKVQPGFLQDPTAWYYERKQPGNLGNLYIDCSGAQDVTKYIHAVYLREAMDFVNPLDAPEFPQEWFWHLSWTLSLGIHTMFDIDWTQGHQETYQLAVMQAREQEPARTAMYFQPDDEDSQ